MALAHVHAADQRNWTALHHAVLQGDQHHVVQLLRAGAGIAARTGAEDTPLHLAVRFGHAHLIPYLTAATTLECQNSQGFTPLQEALLYKQDLAGAMLVAAGASTSGTNNTPSLSSLATNIDAAPAPALLLRAILADPTPTGLLARALNWRDAQGCTLLHLYAGSGAVQQVANLVGAGANRGALDSFQRTPLQLAAAAGHAQLVPLLATPETINRGHVYLGTPVYEAAAGGHAATVQALLAAGAPPGNGYDWGHSPLSAAAERGHMLVVDVLLRALVVQHKQRQQQEEQEQALWHKAPAEPPTGWGAAAGPAAPAPVKPWQESVEYVVTVELVNAMRGLKAAPRCCQLLELVLDVLGPEVTKQVCQHMVQRQYHYGVNSIRAWWVAFAEGGRGDDHLAEALLLGWLAAEERQLLPARLQRLVPGVGGAQQQQQLQQQQLQQQQQEQHVQGQQQQLVQEAVTAAVYGRLESARDKLRQCAQLNLRQGGMGAARALTQALNPSLTMPSPAVTGGRPWQEQQQPPSAASTSQGLPPQQTGSTQRVVPPLLQLVHGGIKAAASRHRDMSAWLVIEVGLGSAEQEAHMATAAQVQDNFLSAWVAARVGGSRELVGAVVAAVKAAQQAAPGPSPPVPPAPAAVLLPSSARLAAAAQLS